MIHLILFTEFFFVTEPLRCNPYDYHIWLTWTHLDRTQQYDEKLYHLLDINL